MKRAKHVLTILFGVLMILGGTGHFVSPDMYMPFIPDFLPKTLLNMTVGVIEIALGVGALSAPYKRLATGGILLLMIAFLPLHIADVFKEYPAIGSQQLALIRLPIQFVLILWAWFIRDVDLTRA